MAVVPLDSDSDTLTVGIAQIAPVWLERAQTRQKMVRYVNLAADQGCQLVAFGEALLPGYPFWIERTDGARFNSPVQKEIHAHYVQQAIQIGAKTIWMQEGIVNNDAANRAREAGLKVVMDKCMLKEHKAMVRSREDE